QRVDAVRVLAHERVHHREGDPLRPRAAQGALDGGIVVLGAVARIQEPDAHHVLPHVADDPSLADHGAPSPPLTPRWSARARPATARDRPPSGPSPAAPSTSSPGWRSAPACGSSAPAAR